VTWQGCTRCARVYRVWVYRVWVYRVWVYRVRVYRVRVYPVSTPVDTPDQPSDHSTGPLHWPTPLAPAPTITTPPGARRTHEEKGRQAPTRARRPTDLGPPPEAPQHTGKAKPTGKASPPGERPCGRRPPVAAGRHRGCGPDQHNRNHSRAPRAPPWLVVTTVATRWMRSALPPPHGGACLSEPACRSLRIWVTPYLDGSASP